MKNFKDKVVTITGAGSGMGRAYAIEFGKLGAKLALNDFNASSLAETKGLLEDLEIKEVYTQAFDVADEKAMYDFAKNVKKHLGNTHIIINNAGIAGINKPAFLIETEQIKKVMNVNFYGVVYGCKAFMPQIIENNEGAIVNVSSVFGLVGALNNGGYSASKFAVRGYTEVLMSEFHKSPISVHCVHPGGIDTNIVSDIDGAKDFNKKYLTTPPEKIAKYLIKCIRVKRAKVIYGKDAYKTWIGSNIVPQNLLNALLWKELSKVVNLNEYRKFIKNIR